MRTNAHCFLFALLLSFPLFGENRQELVTPDQNLVSDIRLLLQDEGRLGLPFAGPFSQEELLEAVNRVNPDKLSAAGKLLLQRIRKAFEPRVWYSEPGLGAFRLEPEINLQGWLDSGNYSAKPALADYQQKPMLNLPLEFWVLDNLYFTGNFQFKNDPFYIADHPDSSSNLVIDLGALNFHFPSVGGMSLGDQAWNFQFARAPLQWSKGQTGQLVFSPDAGPQDYLQFSTFWERFKFTSLVVGQDIYAFDPNNTAWGYYVSNEIPSTQPYSQAKYLVAHRFDVLPLDNLRLTLSELYFIRGDAFDFRYLNPFLIYHNWFLSKNANSDMSLEFDWDILRGLNFYGMVYVDYLKTWFKDTLYNDPTPGSFAWQLGGEWNIPVENNGWIVGGLEWVRTDPYFYLNDHINMVSTRRIVSNYTGRGGKAPGSKLYDTPFGYKYGPDTQTWFGQLAFKAETGWEASTSFQVLQKGQITLHTLHPLDPNSPEYVHPAMYTGPADPAYIAEIAKYLDRSTPSGPNPQTDLIWTIGGKVNGRLFNLSDGFDLNLNLVCDWINNKNHIAGLSVLEIQTILGVSWKFK